MHVQPIRGRARELVRVTLVVKRLSRVRPRGAWFWLAVHLAALGLQWYTIRASPGLVTHSNGIGWRAICVAFKGPEQ